MHFALRLQVCKIVTSFHEIDYFKYILSNEDSIDDLAIQKTYSAHKMFKLEANKWTKMEAVIFFTVHR